MVEDETPVQIYDRRIAELRAAVAADPSDFNSADGLRLLLKYRDITVGDALDITNVLPSNRREGEVG